MILGIYGTGGLGREVRDMIEMHCDLKKQWTKIIFIDDIRQGECFEEYETYSLDDAVQKYGIDGFKVIIAVGEPSVKLILWNKVLERGLELVSIIHPETEISPRAVLGKGLIIKKGVVISCNSKVGDCTTLQEYCIVGHDSKVGMNCQLSTNVFVGGYSEVGNNTYIGVNVPIKDRVKVGENSIVGMGSVVTKDVEDNVVAIGFPARTIKKNEDGRVFK